MPPKSQHKTDVWVDIFIDEHKVTIVSIKLSKGEGYNGQNNYIEVMGSKSGLIPEDLCIPVKVNSINIPHSTYFCKQDAITKLLWYPHNLSKSPMWNKLIYTQIPKKLDLILSLNNALIIWL